MHKKILLLLVFSVLTLVDVNAQFRLGPIGGLNINRQVFKSNSYKYEAIFKNKLAFNIGAIGEYVFTNKLSIQAELLYTHRGGYYNVERTNISEVYNSNIGYVSLPVMLVGKLDVKSAYLIAGAGPFIEKSIFSNHSYYSNGTNIESGPLRTGTNYYTDQLKPWNAGIKLKAGFELKKGMYLVAFYDIGTADINPKFTVTRNKTYGVQLGYIFSLTEEDRYNRFDSFYEF